MAKFEQGTERGGFKNALMHAFKSAHKAARGGPHPTANQSPQMPAASLNADRRDPTVGGSQAFQIPSSPSDGTILGGGTAPSPATTAKGPVNHNNDPRKISFEPTGHPGGKIALTGGSATNAHALLPKGHQANKIKLPAGHNVDTRGLRGR